MGRRKPKKARRYVDMWAMPGMHPSNIEFLQKLKTADTQHFTKSMNAVGTVKQQADESRKWNTDYLVGVRTDIWKPDTEEMERTLEVLQEKRKEELRRDIKRSGRLSSKQAKQLDTRMADDSVMNMQSDDIERRRLVLKLFKTTGKRTTWSGTIEQVTTTEIHNSLGSKKNLLTMAVMLPRTDYVTTIQENHRTYRMPSVFSFCYFYDNRVWHLLLQRKWFAIGADFDVICEGKSIGLIDGRLFGFGSDSYVNLSEHQLSSDTQFVDLLTLFAASVGYHKAMRKSISQRVKDNLAGRGDRHLVEDEELRLRHNGRSAA